MRKTIFLLAGVLALGGLTASEALSKSRSVEVGDNYFVRDSGGATVSIKRGQRLTWRWEGKNPHNVTVKSGPQKFHSATLRHGATFSHTFTTRGTYVIYCTIHGPKMSMKINVS